MGIVSRVVTVRQAQFTSTCLSQWKAPHPGGEWAFAVSLRFANRGRVDERFNLFDTIYFRLLSGDGKPVAGAGGRDGTARGTAASPVLRPGQTYAVQRPAKLYHHAGGAYVRLEGSDGFGGIWFFDIPGPGAYLLRLEYRNDRPAADRKTPFWTGEAILPALPITIR